MKRMLAWILLVATVLSLWGCAEAPAQPETNAAPTETVLSEEPTDDQQAPAPTTDLPYSDKHLFVKVSAITFSLMGESEDIYLGLVPRELVTWESEDPSVVSVEGGVLTANGVGTTVIRAFYGDQSVEITAGCLAETQEALDALDAATLSAPKRLPPEVDLDEPCTYFDNAAMIGDSIAYFLWQTESSNNYLGDMQFITRQGVSINGLVRRFKNMYFQGREMYIEDITAKCKATRVYIMLGCLDFQVNAARSYVMDSWNTMLDRILAKRPDLEIVIISNIPSYTVETTPTVYNEAVVETTANLKQLTADRGFGFLDLGYYIQDHYGRMPAIYSDDEYHMNTEGSMVWIKVLRYYAQFELEGGTLS